MAACLLNTKTNVLPADNGEIVYSRYSINPFTEISSSRGEPCAAPLNSSAAREIQREYYRGETKWCGHDADDGVDNNCIIKPARSCIIMSSV